jgi:membrane protease subunit HflK
MPWSNQGGGPWQPKNPGPWGQGPQGGGSNGSGGRGGSQPPDLEDLLRKSQDRLKTVLPGGGGNLGTGAIIALVAVGAIIWGLTGIYTVRPEEKGIELVLGRFSGTSDPGLNYNFPAPFGSVTKLRVTTVNTTEIGYRTAGATRQPAGRNFDREESIMLTGDGNIVDVDFNVQWQIDPAKAQNYLFNLQSPESSIKSVAESAMREVIGRRNIQQILTTDRVAIEGEVMRLMQETLDGYGQGGAGVTVRVVQLLKVDPPAEVIEAFRQVQAAQQEQNTLRNQAETYASRVVPEARGQRERIIQDAEAYRERTVSEAAGQAARFNSVYEEYRKAPDVTRQRMFLESMERVLGGTDKIILDSNGTTPGQGGVIPFLPLNELQRRPQAAQQPMSPQQQQNQPLGVRP